MSVSDACQHRHNHSIQQCKLSGSRSCYFHSRQQKERIHQPPIACRKTASRLLRWPLFVAAVGTGYSRLSTTPVDSRPIAIVIATIIAFGFSRLISQSLDATRSILAYTNSGLEDSTLRNSEKQTDRRKYHVMTHEGPLNKDSRELPHRRQPHMNFRDSEKAIPTGRLIDLSLVFPSPAFAPRFQESGSSETRDPGTTTRFSTRTYIIDSPLTNV